MESETNKLYHLSNDETEAVEEGIVELDNGLSITNEESNRQAYKCLNR